MLDQFKHITAAQFEASLSMLNECIQQCPSDHWDGLIAKYPFWMVAYHTLCFADFYLSPSESQFHPQQTPDGLHPRGMNELNDEYPSRRFSQTELLGYITICRRKLREALDTETPQTLAGESGFPRLKFSRAELYLHNMRHVQHHTGQLGAYLRRAGVDTRWTFTSWR
jgi:hypothetical protein